MFKINTGINTEGIAFGNAYLYTPRHNRPLYVSSCDLQTEISRFRQALEETKADLEALSEEDPIFAAHYEIADDPTLSEDVEILLANEAVNAVAAVRKESEALGAMLASLEDEYLSGRAVDVQDVCNRIIDKIVAGCNGGKPIEDDLRKVPEGTVIIAKELAPSDTAKMDFSKITAFVTEGGSRTSHVCIIAKNKGITAVVGAKGCMDEIKDGDRLIVDGNTGMVIINPDEETQAEYDSLMEEIRRRKIENEALANEIAATKSGRRIPVFGNAGNPADIEQALASGADGIGLFRSEFLYMESTGFPDEEAQFQAYRKAAELCGERTLIIRTLDIGGDKSLPYLPFDHENNPFLGWRAIRISLEMKDMFRTQLRALLRASVYGGLRIMFPMIATLQELKDAKAVLEECKAELRAEGLAFNETIKVGMMMETPAAVMIADLLAAECDFFSIGTNDLTQYVMAADRDNAKVAYLCDPDDIAVRRCITAIAKAAREAGIEVGMCGEYASDPRATAFLIEAGLNAFSVNAHAVAAVKSRIREY